MRSKATPILVGLLGFSFLGLFLWARGYSFQLDGVSYEEARRVRMVRTFVSPQARDITAYVVPNQAVIVAAFTISESDFLAWAQTMGWEVEEISNRTVSNVSATGDPNSSTTIGYGLLYHSIDDSDDPNALIRVYAYDRQTGTGYYTQL